MSGFIAVFTTGPATDPEVGRAMLRAMPRRGDVERAQIVSTGTAMMGVSRHEWELSSDFSGPAHVVEDEGVTVVADASVYHRADLRKALAGREIEVRGNSASHLILAAYRAWGTDCAQHLEGDLAFVVWDSIEHRALCARDFTGKRPLFYAERDGSLVVASTVGAVLAHPACSRSLNLTNLGAVAAGLSWSTGVDTSYSDIKVLPGGNNLAWRFGDSSGPAPFWSPVVRSGGSVSSLEDGAEELRGLLTSATEERLGAQGTSTVWMSGGWDSTAVFGAGQAVLKKDPAGLGRQLRPVSISYPVGDPGREDELIEAVAGFWGSPIKWLSADDLRLFEGFEERVAVSDEPPVHLYDPWMRALARGTRACDSRIAFDGSGGDQLFQVSDIRLADLLREWRWFALAKEMLHIRRRGRRHIYRSAVEPILPDAVASWIADLIGLPGGHYLDRPVPAWIRREFVARHGLVERDRAWLPARRGPQRADAETRFYLTAPMWAAIPGFMSGVFLDEGLEVRSPLLDQRIVEFALRRPVEERASGAETKRLLRAAMGGLLPEHVLAPRSYRTGITVGYSRRQMRTFFPKAFDALFQSDLMLADLGIVDPEALRRAVQTYLEKGGEFERVGLFHTLKTELWLRANR